MPAAPLIAMGISAAASAASAKMGANAYKRGAKGQSDAANRVGQQFLDTSNQQADLITGVGERGAQDVTSAAQRASERFGISVEEANALLRDIYGDAIAGLEPYQATGRDAIRILQAATGPGGDFNRTFTGADLENEPGYQFRLAEGAKALERSGAARGTLLGGRGLKEMERFSQGYASDEFGKAFQRFREDRSDRFGQLYNLSGLGMRATETGIGAGETYGGRVAANTMTAGKYEGDINYAAAQDASRFRIGTTQDAANLRMRGLDTWGSMVTGAANANANAGIGVANAWSAGLSGIGNAFQNYAYLTAPQRNPWDFKPLSSQPAMPDWYRQAYGIGAPQAPFDPSIPNPYKPSYP